MAEDRVATDPTTEGSESVAPQERSSEISLDEVESE